MHDSVVLWTRLVDTGLFGVLNLPNAPITVRWELAHDEAFTRMAHKGQAQALPKLGHSVHVEAAGLNSGRSDFYRFMVGGEGNDHVSMTGRTRTLPAPDAQPASLRLATLRASAGSMATSAPGADSLRIARMRSCSSVTTSTNSPARPRRACRPPKRHDGVPPASCARAVIGSMNWGFQWLAAP